MLEASVEHKGSNTSSFRAIAAAAAAATINTGL